MMMVIIRMMIEGSLEVKLPTIWTDEKQSREEAEKRKIRRKKSRRERVRRKKMQMREKVGRSRFTMFFQWFGAQEGRNVGSLKRRVRSQLARWEMKNCTPLWHEAHFQVKMYKTHHVRTTFGGWDVEFRKSARHCGAKHISKSKCTKHTTFGPPLEVAMSKKCTPLWREAHFQVKMYKTHHVRTIFGVSDVEKVHAAVAQSTFRSQNVQNTSKHTMYGPFLEAQMSFRVAGAKDCGPCQKWPKREGFVAFPKMMASMGHLKRICKDTFSWHTQYKRHVHARC